MPTRKRAYVCLACGCSAVAGDRRLLAAIGWKVLPTDRDAGDLPALCARCAKRAARDRDRAHARLPPRVVAGERAASRVERPRGSGVHAG